MRDVNSSNSLEDIGISFLFRQDWGDKKQEKSVLKRLKGGRHSEVKWIKFENKKATEFKGETIHTLSSRVRSNHWAEYVFEQSLFKFERWRPRPEIRSQRIGLRLYAIADEPLNDHWVSTFLFYHGSAEKHLVDLRCVGITLYWYMFWEQEKKGFWRPITLTSGSFQKAL